MDNIRRRPEYVHNAKTYIFLNMILTIIVHPRRDIKCLIGIVDVDSCLRKES